MGHDGYLQSLWRRNGHSLIVPLRADCGLVKIAQFRRFDVAGPEEVSGLMALGRSIKSGEDQSVMAGVGWTGLESDEVDLHTAQSLAPTQALDQSRALLRLRRAVFWWS